MSVFYCNGHMHPIDSDFHGHNEKDGKEYCDDCFNELENEE